jgi:hypothetical protein
MKLSDVVGHSGLAIYAEIALVLFVIAFLIIGVKLLLNRNRRELERMSRMPLDDDRTTASSENHHER